MYKPFIFLFLIITCCNCTQPAKDKTAEENGDLVTDIDSAATGNNVIFQNWETDDAIHPQPKDLFNHTDSGIYNYPGMSFFTDSFLVENPRGEIRLGKFSLQDSNIIATFLNGEKAKYLIKEISSEEMVLVRNENNKQTLLTLKGDGVTYHTGRANPFHPYYNQWRIKPKKTETSEEIKVRLKNYIEFCMAYFKDVVRRKAGEVDFQGIPNCFKWYQGGIFVQNEKNLDKKFIECFYDKSQALQARQTIEDALGKKYKWEKNEDNWVKQITPVLQQIKDSL